VDDELHVSNRLRYVPADRIEFPLPSGPIDVRDRQNKPLGLFDGVIYDTTARHVCFLVVETGGFLRHHRYLLPVDPTRVDMEHRALRVEVDRKELDRLPEFNIHLIPQFSDADFMRALFSPPEVGFTRHVR